MRSGNSASDGNENGSLEQRENSFQWSYLPVRGVGVTDVMWWLGEC